MARSLKHLPLPKPRVASSKGATSRPWLSLGVAIGLTVGLYLIPYGHTIGYPLVLLSTLAHEMGHGIAGVLVGGNFDSFVLNSDASGVAHVSGYDGRFARAFVSAGGLCGPAVTAALAFVLARRAKVARYALIGTGVMLVIALVWVVRSFFGWFFIGLTAAALLAIGLKAKETWAQLALVLVAVQLALSVFSRGDYLFTDTARMATGDMPSDVANMASALFLPYWFWGALCGAFSVVVLIFGALSYVRGATADTTDPLRKV